MKAIAIIFQFLLNQVNFFLNIAYCNVGNGTHEIEEVELLQFYVDLSRKLSGSISNMLPFINYGFISNPPRFTKLEK